MKDKAHKACRMVLPFAVYLFIGAGLAIGQCGALPGIPKIACEAATKAGISKLHTGGASSMLTTAPSDAIRAKMLDPAVSLTGFQPISNLAHASDGSFILKPGLYEAYVESYYFDDQDAFRPTDGAFFPAPLLGPRAAILAVVLAQASSHPQVKQPEIQQLISAIYSGAYLEQMPPQTQQTAVTLLPDETVRKLQANTLSNRIGKKVVDYLSKRAAEASQATSATANNSLPSAQGAPALNGDVPAIARGTWAQMPGGFYVRYLPDSCTQTRIQILVPPSASGLSDPSHPLIFDPTQYLAILAQSPTLRLGITLRQIDVPKQ